MADKKENYDLIVIGGGVSGLAASMYAARLELKTLCLGSQSGSEFPLGGVITTTNIVENYPGFVKIPGRELAEKIKEHALDYEKVTLREERVLDIEKKNQSFIVKTHDSIYETLSIIFATGTKWKKLNVPGSKEFENRGVVYCALCDAPLFKNKVVCVIGGSDTAIKDALVVAEHAKKVYIIYRGGKLRGEPSNCIKLRGNDKIEIITNTNVTKINGGEIVESVTLDKKYEGKNTLEVNGVFVAIGHVVLSDLAKKIGVKTNKIGEIKINHKTSQTNIEGIFAAGDVTDKEFKQAIVGVSEGCVAAYSAFNYLKSDRGKIK